MRQIYPRMVEGEWPAEADWLARICSLSDRSAPALQTYFASAKAHRRDRDALSDRAKRHLQRRFASGDRPPSLQFKAPGRPPRLSLRSRSRPEQTGKCGPAEEHGGSYEKRLLAGRMSPEKRHIAVLGLEDLVGALVIVRTLRTVRPIHTATLRKKG